MVREVGVEVHGGGGALKLAGGGSRPGVPCGGSRGGSADGQATSGRGSPCFTAKLRPALMSCVRRPCLGRRARQRERREDRRLTGSAVLANACGSSAWHGTLPEGRGARTGGRGPTLVRTYDGAAHTARVGARERGGAFRPWGIPGSHVRQRKTLKT
jgi:hypothetical protein